jgi:outer membrane lipoprotein
MKIFLHLSLATFILLAGCTTIISEQSRKLVDTDARFSELRAKPESYIGKHIMLGGRIAGVRNSTDGAQIEVVQFDLTDRGIPEDSFISYGRFLATSSDYLDAMIFQKGMLIVLVGEIKGKRILRLDDMDYSYPVVAIREFHLWKDSDFDRAYLYQQPPYYSPYYFGYGYEPFMPRIYGPVIRPY